MSDSASTSEKGGFYPTALTTLRLGVLLIILYWCYRILAPFIPLLLWGAILAVATYPMHRKLAARLGNRLKISATLITLLGLIVLTTPVIVLTESLVSSSKDLAENISEGSVELPPPPERVKRWPLVGERLHSGWQLASENLGVVLEKYGPQLEAIRDGLIATAGGAGAAFLQMFISIIIAGIFLATAEGSVAGARVVMSGLVGERGPLLLAESTTTVRSVARGVLGVAILESIVAAIGLGAAGVPAAGFWTFLILVLSIVQVPPLLTLVPLSIWALAATEPFGATVLVICSILAVGIDTFLKPVLLGRTADAPMLVVLLGAIGGMMVWGIVGLFVGAVILVLCWGAMEFWVMEETTSATIDPPQIPPVSGK
jgi:predicted PurR-regulated permease PerM